MSWGRSVQKQYTGDGRDIVLQGFHWPAHAGARERDGSRKSWYGILRENAARIKTAGFTWVWFPPAAVGMTLEKQRGDLFRHWL